MHLRTKLFVSIGLLLVLVTFVMYFLPDYLVQSDIQRAENEIKRLVQNQEQELLNDRQTVIKQELANIQQSIDGLLYLIADNHLIREKINLRDEGFPRSAKAEYLAKVVSTNPRIGFIQLHQPSYYNLTIVTSPLMFKPAQITYLSPSFALVRVYEEKSLYFAVSHDKIHTDLILFNEDQIEGFIRSDKISNEMDTLIAEISSNLKKYNEQIQDYKNKNVPDGELFSKDIVFKQTLNGAKKSYKWGLGAHLIAQLAPIVEGVNDTIPAGILHIDQGNFGSALFSRDLFRSQPIFEDISYYLNNRQTESNLASGSLLIDDPLHKQVLFTNTLLIPPLTEKKLSPQQQVLNGSLISIGMPIDEIVQNLAISSDRTVLVSFRGQLREGFRDNGEKISSADLSTIPFESIKDRMQGTLQFQESVYDFSNITINQKQGLQLFLLNPQEKEKVMAATLNNLHRIVTDRISFHILLVAIGSLIIALLILGKISLNVTKPITSLAKATEAISSGKYDEVRIPDLGMRKDEIAILTNAFKEMVEGLQDREKIRGVLNKVVSKDVADEILKSNIHLGGEDRACTIMFSDIRGFTKLSENLPPQTVIKILNNYMTKMSHIIEGEGGVIDKYVGDEIMALYGAPTSHPDHAIRALSSAVLMMEMLKGWNKERIIQNLPPIEMGIGIHTGIVVAGNMGAEDRLNYTVIGANVNLAARLCSAAQPMQIILSKDTYEAPNVKDSFVAKPLAPLQLKGISEPIMAYELIGFQWDTA